MCTDTHTCTYVYIYILYKRITSRHWPVVLNEERERERESVCHTESSRQAGRPTSQLVSQLVEIGPSQQAVSVFVVVNHLLSYQRKQQSSKQHTTRQHDTRHTYRERVREK